MHLSIVEKKPGERIVWHQGMEFTIRYVFLTAQKRFRWMVVSAVDRGTDRAYNPLEVPEAIRLYLHTLRGSSK